MKNRLFDDLSERDVLEQGTAQQKRGRLALVRNSLAGTDGAPASDEDARSAELAEVLALGTDAANFVIADLAACLGARAFVDAAMGATGGSDEFVYITDEQLSERLGKSTKTVQTYRKEFCTIKNHRTLIEVKKNWRNPETHESFPHRYRCKLTKLAVEAMQNAQLAPGWSGDADAKMRAMRDAAETVARGASGGLMFVPTKRKTPTDAEVVASKLRSAANALDVAAKRRRMVKNPDFEQLAELRETLLASLQAFDEASDFAAPTSIQIQEEESGNAAPVADSGDPAPVPRVAVVESPQVEKLPPATTQRNQQLTRTAKILQGWKIRPMTIFS